MYGMVGRFRLSQAAGSQSLNTILVWDPPPRFWLGCKSPPSRCMLAGLAGPPQSKHTPHLCHTEECITSICNLLCCPTVCFSSPFHTYPNPHSSVGLTLPIFMLRSALPQFIFAVLPVCTSFPIHTLP